MLQLCPNQQTKFGLLVLGELKYLRYGTFCKLEHNPTSFCLQCLSILLFINTDTSLDQHRLNEHLQLVPIMHVLDALWYMYHIRTIFREIPSNMLRLKFSCSFRTVVRSNQCTFKFSRALNFMVLGSFMNTREFLSREKLYVYGSAKRNQIISHGLRVRQLLLASVHPLIQFLSPVVPSQV